MPFVFPDPESSLLVNSGLFALNPGRAPNRRLLDAEARFCHLLRAIQALPAGERYMRGIDVEDELFQALNKVHWIKERHWQAKAYPNRCGGLNVDNRRRFTRKQMTKEAPTLIAALIIYVKFQTPVRKMRVILALFRCIIKGLMRRQKIDSQVASRIPEDIHTIVNHYDLDPTLHISIACPNCYALFPFTNEAISNSETALRANQALPVCNERSHPDLPPCGAALWRTRCIGTRTFVTPIRKQAFQDLQEWIGRILAIPGLEDIIDQHQQRPLPTVEFLERDFIDSSTFRCFKGADVTIIPGKPSRHNINHTLRRLVQQLLPFWKGVYYLRTARYTLGRTIFAVLIPAVCDTEGAHQLSGFASPSHTYFCRRCLLPIQEIHNLDLEKWVMRDGNKHRQLAFEWRDAPIARRNMIYQENGLRWSELLDLPYWDPIRFTVIDDMHLGYLGLFETHLREIWKIDDKKNGGNGLHPDTKDQKKISNATKKAKEFFGISPLCSDYVLDFAPRKQWSEVAQRMSSQPEEVPEIPPLNYDKVPDDWKTYNTTHPTDTPVLDEVTDTNLSEADEASNVSLSEADEVSNVSLSEADEVSDSGFSKARQKYGSDDDYVSKLRFDKLKQTFEADEPSRSSLMKFEHEHLEKLCAEYKIPPFDCSQPGTTSLTKDVMVQWILIWRQEYCDSSLKPNYGSSPRHVIGKDLLEEIWADMKRTVLPNWIQPPPSQWGTSASGKLSADEYKMLENFLDLVHSMRVLFFRETSQKSRAYYKSHILKYLRGVLELYPDFTLKPNHHHAVHVVTDLETMGPGHARSTPVFERINHSLQQLNTNRRLGEVETTMLTSYCREANLQVILDHSTDLQGEINEAITALTDIDCEDHRGIFAGTDLVAWAIHIGMVKFLDKCILWEELRQGG
ncbi:hypothetical protein EV359DRAFT_65525 [Lentinula novae-zelandiae]|nr:hypothetical protein EV359DRAFT_65525 [Lentinula novae-zelandiae]